MSKNIDSFFKSFADADSALDYKMGHETLGEKVPVISTGSLSLDDALSSGGLPCGRLIQYYGESGCGKTLLTMIACREAQEKDPTSRQVFIDSEGTFSPEWAESLGVDTSRMIIVEGDMAVNGRKCFEMLLGTPREDKKTHHLNGKMHEGLLDKIASKNPEFNINLIILDSLGSIIPPGEDTSAVGKMNMALLARFLTTTFRKLSLEVNKAKIPFIIINHKKSSMDMYSDHTFSGGNSYSHFLSANVYFSPVNRADAKIIDDNENKIGQTIRAKIEKSKFGAWPKVCEFRVDFGVGVIDRHEEVAKLATDYEIVKRPSTVSYEYKEYKWKGAANYAEAIRVSPDLQKELVEAIEVARNTRWEIKKKEQELRKSKFDATLKVAAQAKPSGWEDEDAEESDDSEEAPISKRKGAK